MHLYIITRGIKHLVDDFITQLQGKFFPFKYRNPETKQLETFALRVSVRPIQLWEIVYPEEANDTMLSTLLQNTKGEPQHKKHSKFVYALRKMLGIEPIPEYKKVAPFPLIRDHVETTAIGIKKDYWTDKDGKQWVNPTEEQKKEMWEGI